MLYQALNTYVTKVLSLLLVPKGGDMDPLRKLLSHGNIFLLLFLQRVYVH